PPGGSWMFGRRAWNASVLRQEETSAYWFRLGSQTSTSYDFAADGPRSAVQCSTVRNARSSRFSTSSALAVSASSSTYDCSGVVSLTSSTLSNWCCRNIPRTSFPYDPASLRKHGVYAV